MTGRPHGTLCGAVLLVVVAAGPGAAQSGPYGDWMPRRGTVSYDLSLTRDWSPAAIRMTGSITAADAGLFQTHCLQPSRSPLMACQRTVNGTSGAPYMVPAPPSRFAGTVPPGGGWSFPGNGGMPRWGGRPLPGVVPPPFALPGRGPDFDMSGTWEWQGWRVSGTFRFSGASW